MKGKSDCFRRVVELYFMCAELDTEVEPPLVVWFPRDSPGSRKPTPSVNTRTDGWWRATLTKSPVKARCTLTHRPDLFLPGPQMPQADRRAAHAPRNRVEAMYVVW